MFKKLSEVQTDLQAIADQVGAERFDTAKAAYLKGIVVTDEDGKPLSPDAIKVEVNVPEVTVEKSAAPAVDADTIAKAVRAEFDRATASVTKAAAFSGASTVKAVEPSIRGRSKVFKTASEAYGFGRWAAGALLGHEDSKRWLTEKGIKVQKVGIEGSNNLGGALVPDEYESTLIDLRETYGVFRQHSRVDPMAGDMKRIPRRRGGLTAYFVGENASITASDMSWDTVTLTARKIAVLTKTSNELNDDAFINLGDKLAEEISYAFANKEDDCGFNGDGTSTYGGIVGVRPALRALHATATSIAGLFQQATGSTWGAVVLSDFNSVMSKLPMFARTPKTAWYCHSAFYESVMQKAAYAAGGVPAQEIKNGVLQLRFLGYPVVLSQVLPSATASGAIACLFGDLSQATTFGDRKGTEIAMATQGDTDFAQDRISWRGTERFDIVAHDVGSAATAGPIVGLITG